MTVEELQEAFERSREQRRITKRNLVHDCVARLRRLGVPDEALKPIEDWLAKDMIQDLIELRKKSDGIS